jgi:NlpC/P60 family
MARGLLGLCAALLLLVHVPLSASEPGVDSATDRAGEFVWRALSAFGAPYRWGGSDPETGLDCSGLVHWAGREALGVELPRRALELRRAGRAVARDDLRPGDLVFFNTLGRAYSHVGIYVGESQFVHAPARRGTVRVESMRLTYWEQRFNGARRLAQLDDGSPVGAAGEASVDPEPSARESPAAEESPAKVKPRRRGAAPRSPAVDDPYRGA